MDVGASLTPETTAADLRSVSTRALNSCCDECRSVLREQLLEEELGRSPETRSSRAWLRSTNRGHLEQNR
jgi:hypothetical protein